jgi:hypothetical protein
VNSDKHLTPKIPNDCPPLLHELMEMCWKPNPNERPVSFWMTRFQQTTRKGQVICFLVYSFLTLNITDFQRDLSNIEVIDFIV